MRSLGAVLSAQPERRKRRSTRRYRRNSIFIDPHSVSRPIDRNARARILMFAEALERHSKPAGGRNGALGYVGLTILRALLLRFLGVRGACFPSYEALQQHTGLARASIAAGLRRLEAAGIVKVIRRLVRKRIVRDGVELVTTVQTSNAYLFSEPSSPGEQQQKPTTKHRLCKQERTEPARPQIHQSELGELVRAVLKRSPPNWRASARLMAGRKG